MTRRNLILSLFSATFLPKAYGISATDISYTNNPGFSAFFFQRFWKFHNRNFFNHEQHWPASLLQALMNQVAAPNEFYLKLPNGRPLPRFQWVYEVESEKLNSSVIEWFDLEKSAALRKSVRAVLPYLPKEDWCGVTWDMSREIVTCHSLVNGISEFNPKVSVDQYESFGLRSQVYEGKRRIAEEFTVFAKSVSDSDTYRNGVLQFRRSAANRYKILTGPEKAVEVRRLLSREFRIYEATNATSPDGRKQRLFYI